MLSHLGLCSRPHHPVSSPVSFCEWKWAFSQVDMRPGAGQSQAVRLSISHCEWPTGSWKPWNSVGRAVVIPCWVFTVHRRCEGGGRRGLRAEKVLPFPPFHLPFSVRLTKAWSCAFLCSQPRLLCSYHLRAAVSLAPFKLRLLIPRSP